MVQRYSTRKLMRHVLLSRQVAVVVDIDQCFPLSYCAPVLSLYLVDAELIIRIYEYSTIISF